MKPAGNPNNRPSFKFERACRKRGFLSIAGIDEAGRGALAGPVVAAAVVLPELLPKALSASIDDSKKLTPKQRETTYHDICKVAVTSGVGIEDAARIDLIGIVPATKSAMRKAIRDCKTRIDFLLIDAVTNIGIATPSESIIRGDSQSLSIAAASIVAKVTRDRIMSNDMEVQYPGYRFASHKGYGTPAHFAALEQIGPSPIHRRTFRPVSQIIADEEWSALGTTSTSNIAGRSTLRLPQGIGKNAEKAAARHLQECGYRVIAKNFKTRHGEIDIIAEHQGTLVFVEVKGRNRSDFGSPLESVTAQKLRRIENAAVSYIATEVGHDNIDWRIDVVGVTRAPDGKSITIDVVQNACF